MNTIILAKIWYLATVFPIPVEEIVPINMLIFDHLCSGKYKNPIKQETVYQTKENGGLNFKKTQIQQKARQIKDANQIADLE